MFERLRQIDARLAELRSAITNGDADMDAIETELNSLTEERSGIVRRMEMLNTLNQHAGNPVSAAMEGGDGQSQRRCSVDSVEYRAAWAAINDGRALTQEEQRAYDDVDTQYRDVWAAAMLGHELTAEQRSVFNGVNAEYRAFVHDTQNTAVLIPNTVVAGIWRRTEEAYPLWGDVRKFHIRGTLSAKRHESIDAGDATWYDEEAEVADEKNTFGEITLTGCELAKSVTVSWKLRAMAVADFIPFLEREVAERAGVALGNAAYSGKGKPGDGDDFVAQPRGIKTYLQAQDGTPQVVKYPASGLTEAVLRTAVSKLHSSYLKSAVVYCNNKTAWTTLAGIQDGNKRPIFLNDVSVQGAVGRVFGMPVKIDASVGDGEILIGSANAGYWANINEDLTMHREDHVKQRKTDYTIYGIVDGDVFDAMAFALVLPEAAG